MWKWGTRALKVEEEKGDSLKSNDSSRSPREVGTRPEKAC